jgi:NAD(P)-dependent dehydrogenase (short-subunit alcohol dehydrogenase family)
MINVVITGSTRGIGFGLAREFLKSGCRVAISGRKQPDVDRALEMLGEFAPPSSIQGLPCDVSDSTQVETLWNKAVETFGTIDIWINNAGISHAQAQLWELPSEAVSKIISTNITGLMFGCSTAARGMIQQGHGAIYNMEGLGSNGMKISGLSVYGTTKAAVRYFSEALRKEISDLPITIGELLPGMVITDLITGQNRVDSEGWEKNKKVYNILANREEKVTPWLVKKILSNTSRKPVFKYVSVWRMIAQLFSALFFKRDLFADMENRK